MSEAAWTRGAGWMIACGLGALTWMALAALWWAF